jgi:hypothetical protein
MQKKHIDLDHYRRQFTEPTLDGKECRNSPMIEAIIECGNLELACCSCGLNYQTVIELMKDDKELTQEISHGFGMHRYRLLKMINDKLFNPNFNLTAEQVASLLHSRELILNNGEVKKELTIDLSSLTKNDITALVKLRSELEGNALQIIDQILEATQTED